MLNWFRKTYQMSRTQTSGFGTIGAAFLYFDALKRHAIFHCFQIETCLESSAQHNRLDFCLARSFRS